MGKFHPLIVHLPIGILMVFLVLAIVIPRKRLLESYQLIRIILLFSALSATFSCITGLILIGSGEYDVKLATFHRTLGFVMALLNWIIFVELKKILNASVWSYYSTLLAILLITIWTGHLGGTLTHGSGFLTPPRSNEWFRSSSDSDEKVTINSTALEAVSVILEGKCYSCHGQTKQKGNLRLDTRDGILAGGKEGSLFAKNESESLFLKRIMLPLEDEDHMPPKEKKQLTALEISFLSWWLNSGANLDKSLSELNLPDSLQGILTNEKKAAVNKLIPETDVTPVNPMVLGKLKSLHVLVAPIAENSNYLSVSFMNVLRENSSEAVEEMIKLNQQLLMLNLDYQDLDSMAWQKAGTLINLRKLTVKNSNLDDQKLDHLKTLSSLVSLNVVGTNVTSSGLKNIMSLPNLESVYTYQTGIGRDEFMSLKNQFPTVKIDSGNYSVPTLESDTTVFTLKK